MALHLQDGSVDIFASQQFNQLAMVMCLAALGNVAVGGYRERRPADQVVQERFDDLALGKANGWAKASWRPSEGMEKRRPRTCMKRRGTARRKRRLPPR